MRHHSNKRKFGREKDQRNALMKTLAVSFFRDGSITTTEAKAKELRPYVEKFVTMGKEGTLAARRLIASRLGSPLSAKRVCEEIAPKYKTRMGGYTRITKLPRRANDASKMAEISFV